MRVLARLQSIFKEKFHCDVNDDHFSQDISIGAAGIGLTALEMFYLLQFIEKEFNIRFTQEHIISGSLRSLSGLYSSVEKFMCENVQ